MSETSLTPAGSEEGERRTFAGGGTGAGIETLPTMGIRCDECGYDRRGLGAEQPCPECGQPPRAPHEAEPQDLAWRRTVAVGLWLMLLVTIHAIASVLVQPFTDEMGGTLPALNVTGPKLWVVPLLQRPIGDAPERPGMVGTRAALLSLLALWLITARRSEEEDPAASSRLRELTRWCGLLLFGLAFGLLLASHGISPDELPPYRLALVALVELPAAALLYAYLRRLASEAPGRDRRRIFDHLRWAVPAIMLAGAAIMASDWLLDDASTAAAVGRDRLGLLVSAAYGAAAVTCGMIATATVGSLAVAFTSAGFPRAWRVVSGLRRSIRAGWRWGQSADTDRLRVAVMGVGLALLALSVIFGNEQVLWYVTRDAVGGNLPFYNFPGPKVWVSAAVPQLAQRYYWEPLVSRVTLLALNLAAVWMITIAFDEASRRWWLRRVLRWVAVAAVGVALGAAISWSSVRQEFDSLSRQFRSEYFAGVTVLCEVPATVLLYIYLARLAGRFGLATSVRRQFLSLSGVIIVMVGVSFLAFLLARSWIPQRRELFVLILCALYGALTFAAAVWATGLVLKLASCLFGLAVREGSTRIQHQRFSAEE